MARRRRTRTVPYFNPETKSFGWREEPVPRVFGRKWFFHEGDTYTDESPFWDDWKSWKRSRRRKAQNWVNNLGDMMMGYRDPMKLMPPPPAPPPLPPPSLPIWNPDTSRVRRLRTAMTQAPAGVDQEWWNFTDVMPRQVAEWFTERGVKPTPQFRRMISSLREREVTSKYVITLPNRVIGRWMPTVGGVPANPDRLTAARRPRGYISLNKNYFMDMGASLHENREDIALTWLHEAIGHGMTPMEGESTKRIGKYGVIIDEDITDRRVAATLRNLGIEPRHTQLIEAHHRNLESYIDAGDTWSAKVVRNKQKAFSTHALDMQIKSRLRAGWHPEELKSLSLGAGAVRLHELLGPERTAVQRLYELNRKAAAALPPVRSSLPKVAMIPKIVKTAARIR